MDGVRDVDRDLRLGADALGQPPGVRVPAAGVDHGEGAAVPDGVVGDPVAGDAGLVLDHGLPAADDPVDQGRLAHVGAADHGQDRDYLRRFGGDGVVGAHALFFSRLGGPSGPGRVMPVFCSASANGLEDRGGDDPSGLGHLLLRAWPGRLPELGRVRRRSSRSGCRAAGWCRQCHPASGCPGTTPARPAHR